MTGYDQVLVEGEDILRLIPQRAPFVMLDKLLYHDLKKTVSSFYIKSDNIFCENGILSESALIENIAQTAALKIGFELREKSTTDQDAPLGFIGGISDIVVHRLPSVNSKIITEAVFLKEILDVLLISGIAWEGEEKLVECEMKLFIKK